MLGFDARSSNNAHLQFGHLVLSTPNHPGTKAGKSPAQYAVSVSNFVLNDTPGRIYLDNQVIADKHPGLMKLERALTRLGKRCAQELKAVTEYVSFQDLRLERYELRRSRLDRPITQSSVEKRGKILDEYRQKVTQEVIRPLQRILNGLSQQISDADRRNLLKAIQKPGESYATPGSDASETVYSDYRF
jgi:adenylate kinase family enzyme